MSLLMQDEEGLRLKLCYYHAAAVLMRLVNGLHHSHTKQWVAIEQLIAPYDLQALPWVDRAS